MRKNPTAKTIKRKAKGYRTKLAVTPTGGMKSMQDREKTSAGGKAGYRISAPQTDAEMRSRYL